MTTIHISVEWWRPQYHGFTRESSLEWPPSPFRLAQALMAGCHLPDWDSSAHAALSALVQLPNPVIIGDAGRKRMLPPVHTHRSGGPLEGKPLTAAQLPSLLDGAPAGLGTKNRTAKPRGVVLLQDHRLVFEVEDPDETVDVTALDRAAHRVPYLGRSEDVCDITVAEAGAKLAEGQRWTPKVDARGPVTGWSPGSLEWMDLEFAATRGGSQLPPLPVEQYVERLTYRASQPLGNITAVEGVDGRGEGEEEAQRTRVIATSSPVHPSQIQSVMASIGRLADPIPVDVRAFPCVVAGHRYADGTMQGIGVTGSELALVKEAAATLAHSPGLSPEPRDNVSQALRTKYWERESNTWVSATPFRAFPDQRVASYVLHDEVQRRLGLEAREVEVHWSAKPERPWQHRWRQPPDGLGCYWLEMRLPVAVSGPMQLGASTELGFGLFVPAGG